MTDKASLIALKERVNAATGPDASLDGDILRSLGAKVGVLDVGDGDAQYWFEWPSGERLRLIDPTASVDAALALVERVLPKMAHLLFFQNSAPAKGGFVVPAENRVLYYAAATPALAIVSAALAALIAEGA